jgi:hypothetical protein
MTAKKYQWIHKGVDKFSQALAIRIVTRQIRKQIKVEGGRISEREQNPRQAGEF